VKPAHLRRSGKLRVGVPGVCLFFCATLLFCFFERAKCFGSLNVSKFWWVKDQRGSTTTRRQYLFVPATNVVQVGTR
jgi:hypothetical protein